MNRENDDINRAVQDWENYYSTPFAPQLPIYEYIGWTREDYDHWLETGNTPVGWKWDR